MKELKEKPPWRDIHWVAFAFARKGWFQTFTVRNKNNPRGLLRKCFWSSKWAGFWREPAEKIFYIMCVLGVGDVFKTIWSL